MQTNLGTEVPHPQEIENRLAYAQRIIAFLDQHVPHAQAANLAMMNRASWNRTCSLAGEAHMPSLATISTIVGMVHGRSLAVEAITGSLAQPEKRLLNRTRLDRAPVRDLV